MGDRVLLRRLGSWLALLLAGASAAAEDYGASWVGAAAFPEQTHRGRGPLDRMLEPYDALRERARERLRLDWGVAWTPLVQFASQDDARAHGNHQIDVVLGARLLDDPTWGRGGIRFWYWQKLSYAATTTGRLASALGSSVLPNDRDTAPGRTVDELHALWWQHSLWGDSVRIVLGQLDVNDVFSTSEYKLDDRLFFLLEPLSSDPVPPAFERTPGLGGFLSVRRAWGYASAGLVDANAREFLDFESLGDGQNHLVGEVGLTPRVRGVGPLRVAATFYYTWLAGDGGPSFSLHLEQQVRGAFAAVLRFSQAWDVRRDVAHNLSAALVWLRPFGFGSDRLGLGFHWAAPTDPGLRDQYGVELFWRLQLTRRIDLSPDLQILIHPARRRGTGAEVVGGLRLRLVL